MGKPEEVNTIQCGYNLACTISCQLIDNFLLYYQRLFWVIVYFYTLPYTVSSKWGFTVLLVFIRNENSDQNTISNLGKNNKLSSILKEYYEKG